MSAEDGQKLSDAAFSGDIPKLEELLKSIAIDTADRDGFSALHRSCVTGNVPVITFLLDRGAKVNMEDSVSFMFRLGLGEVPVLCFGAVFPQVATRQRASLDIRPCLALFALSCSTATHRFTTHAFAAIPKLQSSWWLEVLTPTSRLEMERARLSRLRRRATCSLL
jgi:Ankyrin repeat